MPKATKKEQVKTEKTRDEIVAEAMAEIKAVVTKVKKDSFSNFEYLKDEITRMLMQPENI